ncbi:hypothetical protein VRRI112168_03645 [Vreelandella rituensis]|uniref:Uncharacterized protein n=1 Tax=Vreelandella rituensis TaxID=2282306 RepID=A0A368UAS8_9GAMM|nr:hypothetical protein [Halomonas rituensis]RCV93746.1 hypothetical protein DU506_00915 [Halomonas rituensis]
MDLCPRCHGGEINAPNCPCCSGKGFLTDEAPSPENTMTVVPDTVRTTLNRLGIEEREKEKKRNVRVVAVKKPPALVAKEKADALRNAEGEEKRQIAAANWQAKMQRQRQRQAEAMSRVIHRDANNRPCGPALAAPQSERKPAPTCPGRKKPTQKKSKVGRKSAAPTPKKRGVMPRTDCKIRYSKKEASAAEIFNTQLQDQLGQLLGLPKGKAQDAGSPAGDHARASVSESRFVSLGSSSGRPGGVSQDFRDIDREIDEDEREIANVFQAPHTDEDATRYFGHSFRERDGRFGSLPAYDDYDE